MLNIILEAEGLDPDIVQGGPCSKEERSVRRKLSHLVAALDRSCVEKRLQGSAVQQESLLQHTLRARFCAALVDIGQSPGVTLLREAFDNLHGDFKAAQKAR